MVDITLATGEVLSDGSTGDDAVTFEGPLAAGTHNGNGGSDTAQLAAADTLSSITGTTLSAGVWSVNAATFQSGFESITSGDGITLEADADASGFLAAAAAGDVDPADGSHPANIFGAGGVAMYDWSEAGGTRTLTVTALVNGVGPGQYTIVSVDGTTVSGLTTFASSDGAGSITYTSDTDIQFTPNTAQLAGVYNVGDVVPFTYDIVIQDDTGAQTTVQQTFNVTVGFTGGNDSWVGADVAGSESDTIVDGDNSTIPTTAGVVANNEDGDDTFNGGLGDDDITGGAGNDQLIGGVGDDLLMDTGTDNGTTLFSADNLKGQNGDDVMDGGAGNDLLNGGNGSDYVYGGAGEDTVKGSNGDDYLSGGTEDDELVGGKGDDQLFGDAGDDVLRAGDGDDYVLGGAGEDIYYTTLGDNDILDLGAGTAAGIPAGAPGGALPAVPAAPGVITADGDADTIIVTSGSGTTEVWNFGTEDEFDITEFAAYSSGSDLLEVSYEVDGDLYVQLDATTTLKIVGAAEVILDDLAVDNGNMFEFA